MSDKDLPPGLEQVNNTVPAFKVTMQQTPRQSGKNSAWSGYADRVALLEELGFVYIPATIEFVHPHSGWKISVDKLKTMDSHHYVNWVRLYQKQTLPPHVIDDELASTPAVLARLVAMAKEAACL